jgi:DNA-binding transcriptional ArsR family regulator
LKKAKSAPAKAARVKPAKKAAAGSGARKRQTGVRARILELLAKRPLTGSELVAQGGFSVASLYLNLKSLKDDGLVETERLGREVSIRLTGAVEKAATEIVSSSEAPVADRPIVSAYASEDLREALDRLSMRLSPVDGAQEKLMVLDQLMRTMPEPIAGVLRALMTDIARLSSTES